MRRLILASLFLIAFTGCNSSRVIGSWQNPKYVGHRLGKTLIVSVGKRVDLRRNFEDQFARQLQSRGVDAAVSYTMIPEADRVEKTVIDKAVADAGAQSVIISRLVKVEKQTNVSTRYLGPPN